MEKVSRKRKNFAAIITYLSKAFGFFPHYLVIAKLNLLSANPAKWSNTLKQFVGKSRQIVWVCLTILWGWQLTLFRIGLFAPLLYLKKIQKYKSREVSLEFCWHQHFFNGNKQLSLYQEIQIKVFWNKGFDLIISIHDVTNKILSLDSIYIVDVAMWPKFVNSSISMREVITKPQFYKNVTRKTNFFERWSWLSLIIRD